MELQSHASQLPPGRLNLSDMSTSFSDFRIATLRRDGLGVRQIAQELGRSPSTISRELRRNTAAHDRSYDGDLAHARARDRLRRPRRGRLLVDAELRGLVEVKLELEWSPEQIAAWLRRTFPDRPDWHVCHETIYRAIYLGGRGGLRRVLTRRLRTGRPLRKRRRRATERQTRFVTPGRLIDQRPDDKVGSLAAGPPGTARSTSP
jgi:IS30 family transposase